jgi:hypothetical protein
LVDTYKKETFFLIKEINVACLKLPLVGKIDQMFLPVIKQICGDPATV